jgi:hypothetical protein
MSIESAVPCCCSTGPCPCLAQLTSVRVTWTGSFRFSGVPCLRWVQTHIDAVNGNQTALHQCGGHYPFLSRFVTPYPIVFSSPSIVVPISASSVVCGGSKCIDGDYEFERRVFAYTPQLPDLNNASAWCEWDTVDRVWWDTYTIHTAWAIAVSMPSPASFPPNPKWRVTISCGSALLRFISTDPDWTCQPTGFALDTTVDSSSQLNCASPLGNSINTQEAGCLTYYVDTPPPPFSWPGANGYPGTSLCHDCEIVPGTVTVT